MSTINSILAANLPSDPSLGDMYFETDTNKIALWDGSVWRKYNPDSPVVNNNTGAGSSNEIGSAYSEGTMTMTLGDEWPATSDSDSSNVPWFTLPEMYGNPGETTYINGYDYNSNNFGWVDGMGGGQTDPFGGRIYSLIDQTTEGEADFTEYLNELNNILGTTFYSDLYSYVSNNLDIDFMSMGVMDSHNISGFGAFSLYDNNNMASYNSFHALTWKNGSSEVDVHIIIDDTSGGFWTHRNLYTFDVGTVPAYHSGNPVSVQPTSVIIRNAGGYGSDSTYNFSSSAPTFSLTPAVFTS